MKRTCKYTWLVLVLMAFAFGQNHALGQPQPVIPRLRGSVSMAGAGTDVQIVGTYAFVSQLSGDTNHPGGLEIFSVTNPAAPVRIGGYVSDAAANAIQVAGRYAYLGEGTVHTITNDAGAFEIIDVSAPANPKRIGGISTRGHVNSIRVEGNYAYLAESKRWTGTNLLGALEIFDISSPTNPVRTATFDTAGSATSVDLSGGIAYLADGVTDLQAIDVSDPASPRRVGTYYSDVVHNHCGFEAGGPATLVQVIGNLAYSAGPNGLHVLDISDPSHPASVGDNFCFPMYAFRVSGHHFYAVEWSQDANDFSLRVEDASNLANLTLAGFHQEWGPAFQVTNQWAYLVRGELLVYEITDRPAINSLSVEYDWVVLTWDYAPGFVLQRTTSLDSPAWTNVPDSDGVTNIELPVSGGNEFFRLARP